MMRYGYSVRSQLIYRRCAQSPGKNTSSAVLGGIFRPAEHRFARNKRPLRYAIAFPPTREHSPARLQWSGHAPARTAGDRRERCWLSMPSSAIAGAASITSPKGVVERDPVGRTLMKALHAAAEMELLWQSTARRRGRPPEDRVRPGKPGEKYHADRPSAAARGSDRRRAPAGR